MRLPILEASQAGEARRLTVALAGALGFDQIRSGQVAIVVSELTSNLIKYGKDGELLLQPIQDGGIVGLELLALDRGPGIEDIGKCLRDGYSSGGSSGTGLGAIRRLSSGFDIHSSLRGGTAILCRLWAGPPNGKARFEVGSVCLPLRSESVCGDGWAVQQDTHRCVVMLSDGLGHGPVAATATQQAIQSFQQRFRSGLVPTLEAAHQSLRTTRGAVLAIAELDVARNQVRFAGVGNIAGVIQQDFERRSLASVNGTIGYAVHRIQEFVYPCSERATLILHSDGLTTKWNLNDYPGLLSRHPSLIAGVLYRDFARTNDDMTVLVIRSREPVPDSDSG